MDDGFEDEEWASADEAERSEDDNTPAGSLAESASGGHTFADAIDAVALAVDAARPAENANASEEKRPGPKRATPAQSRRAQALHRIHLAGLMGVAARRSEACNSGLLQGSLVSSLPAGLLASVVAPAAGTGAPASPACSPDAIRPLLGWLALRFRPAHAGPLARVEPIDEASLCALAAAAAQGSDSQAVSPAEAACLFVALCRGAGAMCRLAALVDPVPVSGKAFEPARLPTVPKRPPAGGGLAGPAAASLGHVTDWAELFVAERPAPAATPSSSSSSSSSSSTTAAAQAAPGRWVTVCPSRHWVGAPLWMTSSRPLASPPAYVVAVSGSGAVRDVTRRYAPRWSAVAAWRRRHATAEWVGSAAASLQASLRWVIAGQGGEAAGGAAAPEQPARAAAEAAADSAERQELACAELREPLPTSLGAFRSHPRYCLEEQLTARQVLRPRGPVVGRFKGREVWLRECVRELRTARGWLQAEGREVVPEEVGRAARTAKRRRMPKPRAAGPGGGGAGGGGNPFRFDLPVAAPPRPGERLLDEDESDERAQGSAGTGEEEEALYGEWQTREFRPPSVVDGAVPRNRFGNYDLWHPRCLPIGAAHLTQRRVAAACKRLGVSFAPAVTGFEFKAGAMVPRVEGVIVADDVAEAVVDAWEAFEQERVAEEGRKRSRRATGRWASFVNGLLIRQRVEARFATTGGRARARAAGATSKTPPPSAHAEEPSAVRSGSAAGLAASVLAQRAAAEASALARVADAERRNAEDGLGQDAGAQAEKPAKRARPTDSVRGAAGDGATSAPGTAALAREAKRPRPAAQTADSFDF